MSSGQNGRVGSRFFGDPTLTVIKIYMSGRVTRVKMSGRRVGSQFCDPTTSEMTAEGQCVLGKTALLHYWRVVMSLSIL